MWFSKKSCQFYFLFYFFSFFVFGMTGFCLGMLEKLSNNFTPVLFEVLEENRIGILEREKGEIFELNLKTGEVEKKLQLKVNEILVDCDTVVCLKNNLITIENDFLAWSPIKVELKIWDRATGNLRWQLVEEGKSISCVKPFQIIKLFWAFTMEQ